MSARTALRFLLVRSASNRLRRRLQRLRKPRYAIALLVGIGYFALIFAPTGNDPPFDDEVAQLIAGFAIAMFLAWSWLWGGHRKALALSPAETELLLTAPVSRTSLIRYKLLQYQPALLFSALIFTFLAAGRGPAWWLRLPSIWVLLTTIHLHQCAASLVHAAAAEQGSGGARRNAVAIVLFAAALAALGYAAVTALGRIGAVDGVEELVAVVTAALGHPAAQAATLPVRLVLAPTFAETFTAWIRAVPAALIVLGLHLVWVMRTDAGFEEAAVEAGERQAARLAAARAGRRVSKPGSPGRRRHSLPMPAWGPPSIALIWKNVLTAGRGLRGPLIGLLLIAAMAAFVATGIAVDSPRRLLDALAITGIVVAGLLTLVGPLAIRNDLRRDLAHLHLLRTYPLTGRSIVGAEVASSALTLSALQLALLGAALGAAAGGQNMRTSVPTLVLALVIAAVALPVLNALATLIQNALALLFPAWTRPGDDRPGGVEYMGHFMLNFLGALILLSLGLIVPLLLAALGFLAIAGMGGPPAAAAAASGLIFTAGVAAEVVLFVGFLGRLFDRTDPVEAGIVPT